jgi:hypothetical protein
MRRFLDSLTRLRKYVGDRRRSPRRGARFTARLPVSVSPLRDGQDFAAAPSVAGCTRDLGGGGLTLLLPAMRVGSLYLTDSGGYLGVTVETPHGGVRMLAAPARFEQIGGDEGGYVYLIGVRIMRMGDEDRAVYSAYLKTLFRNERRAGERAADASVEDWAGVTPRYVAEAFERYVRHERAR